MPAPHASANVGNAGGSPENSELDQQCQVEAIFALAQIWEEAGNQRTGRANIAARWRDAAGAGEVWNVRGTMIIFKAESYELAGHVIEGGGSVPGLELVAGVQREVWRAR